MAMALTRTLWRALMRPRTSRTGQKVRTQRQAQPGQRRKRTGKTAAAKKANGAAPAVVTKEERDAAIERLVAIDDNAEFENELLKAAPIIKGHVGAIRRRRAARKNAKP